MAYTFTFIIILAAFFCNVTTVLIIIAFISITMFFKKIDSLNEVFVGEMQIKPKVQVILCIIFTYF